MSTINTVLTVHAFGQGLRPQYKRPKPMKEQANWLFFVKDGALTYSDETLTATLVPNHLYVLPANKPVLLTDVDGKRFNHFYIQINCSHPIEEFIDVDIAKNSFLSDFFTLLMKHRKSLDSITIVSLLNTVLYQILPSNVRKSDTAEKIKIFIDEKLPQFSVNDIITRFHYSKRYLDKKFKEAYKISIVKYGKNEQLSYVANVLSEGKSLTDVCDKINYSSPANLSRDFKKHYGVSPAEYKKAYSK